MEGSSAPRNDHGLGPPVSRVSKQVPVVVGINPGLKIGEIAERLAIPVEVAQVVVRPLATGGELEATGVKRGTRYYLKGKAPRRR